MVIIGAKQMRFPWIATLIMMILALGTQACTGAGEETKSISGTIKVMYEDEQQFQQNYGALLEAKFPDLQIEVIPVRPLYEQAEPIEVSFRKLFDQTQPDLIALYSPLYEQFAGDGLLKPLTSRVEEDDIDLAQMNTAIINEIKHRGGGQLYALTPSFNSSVLFYNRKLFRQFGINEPRNGMTWEEVLQIAARFGGGNAKLDIYGYSGLLDTTSPFQLAQQIGDTYGLQLLSRDGSQLMLDQERWKAIIELIAKGIQNGGIYQKPAGQAESPEAFPLTVPFIAGRAAMTVSGPVLLEWMDQAGADNKAADFGMVQAPVDPANPDENALVTLGELFAIREGTMEEEAAWEVLKYINGEEVASAKASASRGYLPVRTKFVQDYEGRSLEPFYLQKPAHRPMPRPWPGDAYQTFQTHFDKMMSRIVSNEQTLVEAVKELQQKGQEALDQARLSGQ